MKTQSFLMVVLALALGGGAFAQSNGLPASDVLGSWDLWGNPTVVGGVSNAGANAHGIW